MTAVARPSIGDGAAAAVLAGLVMLGSVRSDLLQDAARRLDAWAFVLVALAAGALAWRRVAPVPAAAVSVAAAGGYLLAGYAYGPVLLCAGWAMFEVARRRPLRVSAMVAAAAAVVSGAAVAPRLIGELDALGVGLALWVGCWLALPWSLGAVLHVRTAAAAQARRDLTARAALQERIRMSREVHDVVGHGFAVIAMQAGVALVVLDDQPQQARASLEAIRAAATGALAELRGVLQPDQPPVGTVSGIADLPDLVARARAAGLRVALHADAVGPVPAGVDGVAYRVVRESLTNVIRHAGPAEATVTLAREPAAVVVTVTDRGTGPAVPPGRTAGQGPAGAPGRAAGQGLAGLRVRVEAAGGTFVAGPRDGGGFAVCARLPVPERTR